MRDLAGDERIESYFYWTSPDAVERVLPFTGAVDKAPVAAALASLPDRISPLNRMLYLEGKFFLADHNLNYVDKVSMANGVEVRVPFLDPDLVALAARLPPHYKQRGSTGKWVLRKAVEPFLPSAVLRRPKTGFGAPLRHWLRGDLRPMVHDILSERSLRERGIFDPAAVRTLIEDNDARRVDGAYTIFSMMCIELWCRMFIDRPTPELVT